MSRRPVIHLRFFVFALLFSSVALAVQGPSKPDHRTPNATALGGTDYRLGEVGETARPDVPPSNFMTPIGSYRTFGYTDMSGVAVPGDVWTFDHGAPDIYEGWTSDDVAQNDFIAWKQVTATNWAGHGNLPAAPIITGSGSMWLGFYEDEADAACWTSGLGYGNNWRQQFISPAFTHTAPGSIMVAFKYFHELEFSYDVMYLVAAHGGTRDTIATFTGVAGSPGTPNDFIQSFFLGATTFRFIFEFESDDTWSDEDGSYSTSIGAFGFDSFDAKGPNLVPLAQAPPYEFEAGVDGWTRQATPGTGTWADINDSGAYMIADPTCLISNNAVTFHNASGPPAHDAGQWERFTSPPVVVSSYGDSALNVFAEYDIYENLPFGDYVLWTWKFSYYPYYCAASGTNIWSVPTGPSTYFWTLAPECTRYRSFANDVAAPSIGSSGQMLIPAGTDSIRFHLEVRSYSTIESGNFTPMFDNIRIGVSNRSTVLHVPSPTYPTIQSAIDAADEGDTVMVAAGTYTGPGNRDLNYNTKDVVVMSEDGPLFTIIDCENQTRGIQFSGEETSAAVFDGFTIINGNTSAFGTAVRIGPSSSSPVIKNCRFNNTSSNVNLNGIVFIDDGSPAFINCTASGDTTDGSNGVITVVAGTPSFTNCSTFGNLTYGFAVLLTGGAPSFTECSIIDNNGPTAVLASTASQFTDCTVSNNTGDGMYFPTGGGTSIVTGTAITENAGTGVILESNSSSFTRCTISSNNNSGIVFTNVAAASYIDGEPEHLLAVRPPESAASIATTTTFDSCVISGNINTSASGGGIRFDCSISPTTTFQPTWTSCTITGNSSSVSGGGVYVCGNAVFANIAPIFSSCTISANVASGEGGGIHMAVVAAGAVGEVQFDRTIMWENCAASGLDAYADTENVVDLGCCIFLASGFDGSGAINESGPNGDGDPAFCKEATCVAEGTTSGDFTVPEESAAAPENSPCGQLVGAGAVSCPTSTGIVPGDYPTPESTVLLPNAPNPFNPTTTIRFDIAEAGPTMLRIYDARGRLIRTLVDDYLPAAQHVVEWDGRNDSGNMVASGVYFARLAAGHVVETRKMVLLK